MSKRFVLIPLLSMICVAGMVWAADDISLDADETIALDADTDGTVLRSFTIEGEDRVNIDFDRPRISLDLSPRGAPGLDWENAWDRVDLLPVATSQTAMDESAFTGRPWLEEFARDEVVIFRPEAPDMDGWKLSVVDSRGNSVMVREGEGAPPARVAWDGRRDDGEPAWPGLIYSFVLETIDPAGNARTTYGRGFDLPAYRLSGEAEDVLVFAGDMQSQPLILECASWLNQAPGVTSPIEIRATARSRKQASELAALVDDALAGMICGDPGRIVRVVEVVGDAPDKGVVEIGSAVVR